MVIMDKTPTIMAEVALAMVLLKYFILVKLPRIKRATLVVPPIIEIDVEALRLL